MIAKIKTKSRSSIGLDIGTYFVKIMEVAPSSNNRPTLTGIGLKKIAGFSSEETTRALKLLVQESGITGKEVNISVSGPSVIVRFISMPKMKAEDLKSAIRFEAEKFIPFNINDCIIDFQALVKDERENKLSILLVAAKKDYIVDKIRIVEEAGFSVGAVDVDAFAVSNAFLKNFPSMDPNKTNAILNIGATITSLSVLTRDAISFTRDIAMGSSDFSLAVSKELVVPVGKAEELLAAPGERAEDVLNAARPIINNLLDDVKLSFGYHENQSGRSIDEIYISGGAASASGLDEAFQETIGSKPVLWDPIGFLNIDSANMSAADIGKIKYSFAVAAGLSSRQV